MKFGRPDYDAHGLPDIPDDEPVFVIRGKDAIGWAAVEAYANLAFMIGRLDIYASAKKHALAMKEYAVYHGEEPSLPGDDT